MKKEDREINYRPDLASKLKVALMVANNFYQVNFKKAYYLILAEYYKNSNLELSNILYKASKCFDDSLFGEEYFYEYYEKDLKKYNIEILSTARAAFVFFKVYEKYFDKFLEECSLDDLSKMEKFMVESFFKKLKAPMNNPNIEISEGQEKCFYDKDFRSNYSKDLTLSLEYLNKECKNIIEIFNTED